MELKFKNITKCNKEMYYKFLDYHNEKYGTKETAKLVVMIFVILYMIIFNINYNTFNVILTLGIVGIISLVAYQIYHKYQIPKKEVKTSKIKNKEEIIYNFYDKYFEIIKTNQIQKMKYNNICKIHQDRYNFYFYINETRAFIIDKKGFVEGELKDFKIFIKKKCKFKYKKN